MTSPWRAARSPGPDACWICGAAACLVVTDDGVPPQYAETVAAQCGRPHRVTLPQGESSKCFAQLETLLTALLEGGFTRADCVVAVGGGMVCDLAGFAAAVYMRGIDFYHVPTTLLAQVDASVGGKTAVDFGGVKNSVGAFSQPRAVLIDPDTLATLSPRLTAEGWPRRSRWRPRATRRSSRTSRAVTISKRRFRTSSAGRSPSRSPCGGGPRSKRACGAC
jgi:hypothetical protein